MVNLYHRFIACTLAAPYEPVHSLQYLQLLVNTLPGPNRALLLHLLPILKLISDSSAVTKMSLNSLGIIFGPLFLRAAPGDNQALVRDVFTCASTVALLVTHQEELFRIDESVGTLQTIRALVPFKQSNPDELSVTEGDLVHLIKCEDAHWVVEINGVFGTVPTLFLDALKAKTEIEVCVVCCMLCV
jgi:hypothetical protein